MKKAISIVIPVFNEEDNLRLIHDEINQATSLVSSTYTFEIIYINDGSSDNSWDEISALAREDDQVRGVSFSRNFGHQCALEAGLSYAKGDAVITIDADLEQPPMLIPALIGKWEEGNLVVNTKRNGYANRPLMKRMTSNTFYWLINKISDVHIEPGVADYRLLDRHAVNEILNIKESDRFYRGLVQWIGFESTTVEYDPGERINGVSGYSVKKMLGLAWTALTSFSTVPMKAIVFFGFIMTLASWTLLGVMTFVRFGLGSTYFSDMSFLVVFVISSNGIVLVSVGILAMYMLRIYREVQHKPNYILKHTINIEA